MDDIPVARRTTPAGSRSNRWLLRLTIATGSLLLGLTLLLVLRPQPLQRLLAPPPVKGLNARTGIDGRLLGHFPYGELPEAQRVAVAPGLQLHRDAAEELLAMQRDAASSGVDLVVLSAFRSIPMQNSIFFGVKSERNQNARERAMVSAPPGFSEHSTGYAVDLGDGRAPATHLSPSFDQTAAFTWLAAHAARYHFILSFPKGNAQGVSYEPWHWRFEGSAEALKVFEPAQRLAR
jgi:D-alanyl-D-alanine carboxypeptidase